MGLTLPTIIQPAPKYHTKGCSHSSADSPGARTLVFAAFEPFLSREFRASIARTPFCAILWRSPINFFGIIYEERYRYRSRLHFFLNYRLENIPLQTVFVDVLMGLFRGAVFQHGGVPEKSPLTSMGRFPSLTIKNGPFSDLDRPFP